MLIKMMRDASRDCWQGSEVVFYHRYRQKSLTENPKDLHVKNVWIPCFNWYYGKLRELNHDGN